MTVGKTEDTVRPERVRLHITPFNPALFDRIIPPSIQGSASNISYHIVQTNPDSGFGYVEMPAMDAEKLRNKLSGTTLKGVKIRIEEAKPEKKKRKAEKDETEEEKQSRKKAKKEKRKQEQGVLSGRELEEGRHVKRGWTDGDGKDEKKKNKSDKTKKSLKDGDEASGEKKLLFKATIPPNAVSLDKKKRSSKTKEKKEKKEKSAKKQIVVQEFASSQKPPATVSKVSKPAVSYEAGKGWVDEDGDVVEEEHLSQKRKRESKKSVAIEKPSAFATAEDASSESSESLESDPESQDSEDEDGSDEDTNMEDVDNGHGKEIFAAEVPVVDGAAESDRMLSKSDGEQEETAVIPENPSIEENEEVQEDQPPKEVHPLEALYKRPAANAEDVNKPNLKPIDTSFSFFATDAADEDEEDVGTRPPQTPHTKQDMEWRSTRSAAPTPDTAAIGKRFSFPMAEGDDDDDDMEELGDDVETIPRAMQPKADGQPTEESDFRKWFYEHRGDNNRAWKKRRREAKKQERQRENRRLSRKVV